MKLNITNLKRTGFVAAMIGTLGLGAMVSSVPRIGRSDIFGAASAAKTTDSHKEILYQTSHAFNEIAQKAAPAVVSITVVKEGVDPLEELFSGHGDSSPLGEPEHHRHGGAPGHEPGDIRALGVGSGVFIRSDGYILTNYHVIEDGEKITVSIDERHKRPARVIGYDKKTDLAVIKLETNATEPNRGFSSLQFGDSEQIKVGDWAVAIGSPFGLSRTVTSGIISAKGRNQMGILDVEDFIQTDAPINPGSSGGPLLNLEGEMIGLNTAIFSQGGGFVGIGFAIPSSIAKQVSDQIIAKGHVTRGWIGLSAQDMDSELARYFHAPMKQDSPEGALISDVAQDGPGRQASLQPGDVVLKYDQHYIGSASELKSLVGKTPIGKNVELDYLRSGRLESGRVTIREQVEPPEPSLLPKAQLAGQAPSSPPNFGLAVEDTPPEIAQLLEMPNDQGAFIVGVQPGSPAFDSGLEPGDIVLRADQTEIHGAKQFRQVAKQMRKRGPTVFYIQRGPEEKIFVSIKSLG